MRKPFPRNLPNNFYFTGSDIKKFKIPSLLKDIKVDSWSNIPELITIATNSHRRIPKKSKRHVWIKAFKRVKETCIHTTPVSSFAGKMADYLEDEVGQEEFITALHDREMAVLFKRLEQYRARANIKMMIEHVHSMERDLDNMVNANEQREMEDEESDNNSLSD